MDPRHPLPDIGGYDDLLRLLEAFYGRLLTDPEIGHFFTGVVVLDLSVHLPRIARFWEMVLFQSGGYAGDPMAVHLHLHRRSPMTARHFEVWVGHFHATVDALFAGECAERARQRASSIATLMQVRLQRDAHA
jgi:hemoglobin